MPNLDESGGQLWPFPYLAFLCSRAPLAKLVGEVRSSPRYAIWEPISPGRHTAIRKMKGVKYADIVAGSQCRNLTSQVILPNQI